MNMLKKIFGNERTESTASKPDTRKSTTNSLIEPNHAPIQLGIPSEEEISRLPRWAKIAFAARCARRVLPFFNASWPKASAEFTAMVYRTLELVEESAAQGTSVKFLDNTVQASEEVYNTVLCAANAARAVAAGDDHRVNFIVAYAASQAKWAALKYIEHSSFLVSQDYEKTMQKVMAVADEVVPGIRRDFEKLCQDAASLNWTDITPVPQDVFAKLEY